MKSFSINIYVLGIALVVFSCQNSTNNQAYIDKGIAITDSTGIALISQMAKAMGEGGIPHAIEYCKVEAFPITARQSEKYGVKISRVATRNRNEANKASEGEDALLMKWENNLKRDEPLEPVLLTLDKKKVFYRPILLKPLCMACHGEVGKDITFENYAVIQNFYPNDKAVDFTEGSLRGAWKVEF